MTLIEALKKCPNATAKQLAKLMGCSVPTVYRRILWAQNNRIRIATSYLTSGKTGPKPATFSLVRE